MDRRSVADKIIITACVAGIVAIVAFTIFCMATLFPVYPLPTAPVAIPIPCANDSAVITDTIPVDQFNGRGMVTWSTRTQGLTAACWLLPIGTIVRVTPVKQRHGRDASVDVRISATRKLRGPFLALSRSAFKRIARPGERIAICDVEVVHTKEHTP